MSKRTLDVTFLYCLALTFCDVISELLPEWACLTLQGGTTFLLTSKLADIPVSRVRKHYKNRIMHNLSHDSSNIGHFIFRTLSSEQGELFLYARLQTGRIMVW